MDESDVSALFNVKKFHENCLDSVKDVSYFDQESTQFEQYIKTKMDVSDDMIDELSLVTGKKTLECHGEPASTQELLKTVPPDIALLTTGLQKEFLENVDLLGYQKKLQQKHKRYKHNDGPWKQAIIQVQATTAGAEDIVPCESTEVLMSIRIYKNYNPKKKSHHLVPQSEYQVLGSQKLTELRDHLTCPADNTCVGEYSDLPDMTVDVTAKEMYKSGFFYIEGVFFNDMRDPNCRDYSKTIMEWAKEPHRGIGPFSSKPMESVRFIDLNLRIGQPYVYMHQGDCEHILIFSDLRMLHPSECHDVSKYPLQVYKGTESKTKCRVCLMNTARWITKESSLSPEDPCFFCETCFRAFHYDTDGNKLEHFKAFHLSQT